MEDSGAWTVGWSRGGPARLFSSLKFAPQLSRLEIPAPSLNVFTCAVASPPCIFNGGKGGGLIILGGGDGGKGGWKGGGGGGDSGVIT